MGPLQIIVVLAVIVVIAAVALVFFLRRRRAAEAKIAASMPMQELTETDIAWRIGLLDDRPIGLSDYFAGAELSELFAGADKESVDPVVEESDTSLLPVLPVAAAAAIAATSEAGRARSGPDPEVRAQVAGRRPQGRRAADGRGRRARRRGRGQDRAQGLRELVAALAPLPAVSRLRDGAARRDPRRPARHHGRAVAQPAASRDRQPAVGRARRDRHHGAADRGRPASSRRRPRSRHPRPRR